MGFRIWDLGSRVRLGCIWSDFGGLGLDLPGFGWLNPAQRRFRGPPCRPGALTGRCEPIRASFGFGVWRQVAVPQCGITESQSAVLPCTLHASPVEVAPIGNRLYRRLVAARASAAGAGWKFQNSPMKRFRLSVRPGCFRRFSERGGFGRGWLRPASAGRRDNRGADGGFHEIPPRLRGSVRCGPAPHRN